MNSQSPSPLLPALATTHPLSVSIELAALDISHKHNRTTVTFCVSLAFFMQQTFSRFSRVVACLGTSFLFLAQLHSIVWISRMVSSIHQLMDIWVVPFGYYAQCCCKHLCTSSCVNIGFLVFWVEIPKSRIAGSYYNSGFNVLSNCQTGFHSRISLSQQQGKRVPVFITSCQHVVSLFFILVILAGVKWYLVGVWFAKTSDERLSIVYQSFVYSLEKFLFRSFGRFFLTHLFICLY